jgi:SAM-dependent methyltransferase
MWQHLVPDGVMRVLDVGCGDGAALAALVARGARAVRGVDINPQAVAAANARLAGHADAAVLHGSADELPIADRWADLVLCLETLEHVPPDRWRRVTGELGRVLRPGGRLILSVPHRGAFAWLDPANIRFRWPGLYRRVSCAVGGEGRSAGYRGQVHGIVWHHHFTRAEVGALLSDAFSPLRFEGRGCVMAPVGDWLAWPFYRRQRPRHPLSRLARHLMQWDYAVRYPLWLAYDLLVAAERR